MEMNSLVDVTVTSNIDTVTAEQLTTIVDGLSSTYLTATVPSDQHLILTFQLRNHRELVNAYSIQSSSMRPAADPREWKLSGSTDGEKWVQLDYRTNEVFSERNQIRQFAITGNRNTFSWYRLEIGSVLTVWTSRSGASGRGRVPHPAGRRDDVHQEGAGGTGVRSPLQRGRYLLRWRHGRAGSGARVSRIHRLYHHARVAGGLLLQQPERSDHGTGFRVARELDAVRSERDERVYGRGGVDGIHADD